jgi:ectoine hydroxylase-related dioxygenase (phytanoyl-CoA dioxygenase family)
MKYHSKFGGLWIDRIDAKDVLKEKIINNQIDKSLESSILKYIDDGYFIFENAVNEDTISDVLSLYDFNQMNIEREALIFKKQGKYILPEEIDEFGMGYRGIDFYGISKSVRKAMYPKVVSDFLNAIFEEPAIATQSISFNYGSGQAIHKDTAYVLAENPLSLAATWLALEDIEEGTGELQFYPQSHRFPEYLFDGQFKNWTPARDGQEQHQEFLLDIHTQAKKRNINVKKFMAKKGDVLIWHADLAHGGTPILKKNTRKSLVGHFTPFSIKATYSKKTKDYLELKDESGNFFTSRHYDLQGAKDGKQSLISYNGGINKTK